MPRLLTQEWLDLQRAESATVPTRPGATARIQFEVAGPQGTTVFHTHLEDGRIVVNELGPDPDADFTMLVPHDEFVAIAAGETEASVGFMRGTIKVVGNIGRMLSVLPVTTSEAWRESTARVFAATTLDG